MYSQLLNDLHTFFRIKSLRSESNSAPLPSHYWQIYVLVGYVSRYRLITALIWPAVTITWSAITSFGKKRYTNRLITRVYPRSLGHFERVYINLERSVMARARERRIRRLWPRKFCAILAKCPRAGKPGHVLGLNSTPARRRFIPFFISFLSFSSSARITQHPDALTPRRPP